MDDAMRAAWWTPPSEATAPAGRSCRRALAYPPRSCPVPAAAVHHISVGDHMAQAGEYDPGVPQTKSAPGFGRRAYVDDLSTPPTGGPLRSPRRKSTICASRTYEVSRGISPCVTEIACHSLTLCRSGKSQLRNGRFSTLSTDRWTGGAGFCDGVLPCSAAWNSAQTLDLCSAGREGEAPLERVCGSQRDPGCGTLLLYSWSGCSNYISDLWS